MKRFQFSLNTVLSYKQQVLEELRQRDWDDTHREVAPLRVAADAVTVDTSELDFAGSRQALLQVIREKVGQ